MGRGDHAVKRRNLPHVTSYRDRHGKLRWRFRRGGIDRATAALYGSPEWLAWYQAALEGAAPQIGAARTRPGSINALAVAYYASAEWAGLAPTTQRTYRGIIDRFRDQHGNRAVRDLEARHVRALLDRMADRPTAANNLLKVLRNLMAFAVDRDWRRDNPTTGVKPLRYKSDGFHSWTDDEIARFQARWPVGTRERLAFDLLLYTGQRSGDVRRMGRQHVQGDQITVRQEKTGAELEVPILPALARSITAAPPGGLTFILTQQGAPFTAKGFGNWFSAAAQAAGLAKGCSAHGLRKAAARRLAEAGCSAHEIMAITGHRTLKEVDRYTRAAAQRGLAGSAMAKVAGTDGEQKLSNPSHGLDFSEDK